MDRKQIEDEHIVARYLADQLRPPRRRRSRRTTRNIRAWCARSTPGGCSPQADIDAAIPVGARDSSPLVAVRMGPCGCCGSGRNNERIELANVQPWLRPAFGRRIPWCAHNHVVTAIAVSGLSRQSGGADPRPLQSFATWCWAMPDFGEWRAFT